MFIHLICYVKVLWVTTGLVARKLTKLPPVVQKIPLTKGGWISTCWGFYGFLKLIFKLSFKVFPCALGPFRPSMFEKSKVPSAHLNQFAQKREAFCRKAICLCFHGSRYLQIQNAIQTENLMLQTFPTFLQIKVFERVFKEKLNSI